jgi:hypothetical protein
MCWTTRTSPRLLGPHAEKRSFSALAIEAGLLTQSDILASLYGSAGRPARTGS